MDATYNEDQLEPTGRYQVAPRMSGDLPTNQTIPSTSVPPAFSPIGSPSPSPQSPTSNRPSPNVVVGTIVGCIAVPVLALLFIVWWRRQRRRRLSLAYDTGFGNLPYDLLRSSPGSRGDGYEYSDTHSTTYSDAIPLRPFKVRGGGGGVASTQARHKAMPPVSPFSADYSSGHGQPPAAVVSPMSRSGTTIHTW
ncbi:hypothetical protein PG994_000519 [Apiospora phragmitis]|uniref:Uncharacterized protein n=1 Tax=Apiospora phragmitis TaxID=2905665 RepID=A0ABR1X6I1_9PEZI